MAQIQVNSESLKAVLEYMYLDEWDSFSELTDVTKYDSVDEFFEKNPQYKSHIFYHLHNLSLRQ